LTAISSKVSKIKTAEKQECFVPLHLKKEEAGETLRLRNFNQNELSVGGWKFDSGAVAAKRLPLHRSEGRSIC